MTAPTLIDTDDRLRAHTYGLLATLFALPPGEDVLAALRSIRAEPCSDATLAGAWAELGAAARRATTERLDDEYHDLFIGLGRGEIVPFASWYRAGRMFDQPLVQLRADLASLGVRRREGVREPEDHAAAVCETMAVLALDGLEDDDLAAQRRFFAEHLEPWLTRFFRDLQTARKADFFRAVGRLGEAFLAVEKLYLEMADPGPGGDGPD